METHVTTEFLDASSTHQPLHRQLPLLSQSSKLVQVIPKSVAIGSRIFAVLEKVTVEVVRQATRHIAWGPDLLA